MIVPCPEGRHNILRQKWGRLWINPAFGNSPTKLLEAFTVQCIRRQRQVLELPQSDKVAQALRRHMRSCQSKETEPSQVGQMGESVVGNSGFAQIQ